MKFTLGWLKEHLETDAPLEAITDKLTMIGLELEGVADRAAALKGFVVAHVLEARPHPDADKLLVCTVDTGAGVVEVVCGAPNARAGMKGVFAAAGAVIPGTGVTLKKAKIRGVESCGMLLSEREMGLSEEHAGIVELPADAPLGAPAAEVMGLADPVIDVAVTPNRADCLGVRGIARDLAAAGLGRLKPLDAAPVKGSFRSPLGVRLDFTPETASACPYFVGRYVRGVHNGDSPGWLKDRLAAVGLRPISALVDITNLITLEHGRPLHVFDADKVHGGIHVRLARRGERLMALNGKEYALDPEMTVVCDDRGPEALGGIIGGERSGCTAETANVFLEAAYFDPLRTAATGRRLQVVSDARYRFERGVDPAFVRPGAELATRLILELCGGEASELVVAGREPEWERAFVLRPERVRALGGADVPLKEIERILADLGFTVGEHDPGKRGGGLLVTVPSWRGDIVGEADLVEEVARIWGYDRIPAVSLPRTTALPQPALTPAQKRRSAARRALAGRGLVEAVTYSFLPAAQAELFGGVPEALRLVNPISADLDVMRPSILPNLAAAAGRNADRGLPDCALFEIGPQFAGDRPEDQAIVATGLRAGANGPRHWAERPRPVDLFDAKADALTVLAAVGAPGDGMQVTRDAPAWYHPGRSGALRLGPKAVLAWFGELHPRVLKRLGLKGPTVAFEVFLDAVPAPKGRKGPARPLLRLSPLQPVERDFAFVIDDGVPADALAKAAKGADKELIAAVSVFDVFSGAGLPEGKKSVALDVVLQPTERTLTDAEIEAVGQKIVAAVAKATGGTLRG
jgi:phenylalanyl-tRNA synthetase beta chain